MRFSDGKSHFVNAMQVVLTNHDYDEIAVCIGRTGELFLTDGQHRLSMAKILRMPAVPVRVVIRHSEWQRLRERLAQYIRTELRGTLPHSPPHLDLRWQTSRFPSADWFQLIHRHIGLVRGTLLEADGGISGYFASRFHRLGFKCSALEPDSAKAEWMRRIRDTNRDSFEVMGSFAEACSRTFDLVLCLNTSDTDSEHSWRRVRDAAPLADSEIWVVTPTKNTATTGTADRVPDQTGRLLVDGLGFASYTVVESRSNSRWALVKATRLRPSSDVGRGERQSVEGPGLAASRP